MLETQWEISDKIERSSPDAAYVLLKRMREKAAEAAGCRPGQLGILSISSDDSDPSELSAVAVFGFREYG